MSTSTLPIPTPDPTPGSNSVAAVRAPVYQNNGVYWIGQDGNVYVSGSQGTNSAGVADANTNNYWNNKGYNLISDPNVSGSATDGGVNSLQVDPYAGTSFGSTAGYNAAVAQIEAQKQGILSSADDAVNAYGSRYNSGIINYLDSLRSKQSGIDTKAVNNELAKQQGISGVMGMVGRGIRSGGVMLANKNATDSSASEALARAYGDIGQRNLASVGNQYEIGNKNIGLEQSDLNAAAASQLRTNKQDTVDAINTIVADAQEKLYALEAQAAGADLPGRIAIDQEKAAIRAKATQALQIYDQQLQAGIARVTPSSQQARRAQAAKMSTAGYDLGKNAFKYTTQAPGQFQNSGMFASELPLFTFPRSTKAQVA